jgi:hypothetical protein
MTTYALIHGAGDVGWYWHLVEAELRRRGHETISMDLPVEDDSAGLLEYARAVVTAIGGGRIRWSWPNRSADTSHRSSVLRSRHASWFSSQAWSLRR